jgi:putative ABC transport system permease protein
MALGAGASGVLGLVLAATLRPVVAGLVIGLGAAALLGRSMQALLFDVSPLDPAMLTAAALALAVVACAACAVPAWRAARISPLAAMRQR